MRNNIVFWFISYIIILSFLCLVDYIIIMYYLFWINNIIIGPLFWLWIKIIYYNKTILLLLIFYYYFAKFTIKEPGYKYMRFFGMDINKISKIYIDYIWNITVYHIEIFSILIFFVIILIPLFFYNKEILFLIVFFFFFLILLLRIMKNKLIYYKNRKVGKKELFFFLIFLIIGIKLSTHSYFKDIFIMYIHLDKWVFDLLEWKIQSYEKIMKTDYYTESVGLKPKWVGEKKSFIDYKQWDKLEKKKKIEVIDFYKKKIKHKYKVIYYKVNFFSRYIEVKKEMFAERLNNMYEKLYESKKYYIIKNKLNLIKIKEYTPKVDTTNENPVVTQEKEKERMLHQTILFNNMFKFSINNYYEFNLLLKDLTLHKLYMLPFPDHKDIINEKRDLLISNLNNELVKKDYF
jgi:hypothetical protein